MISRKSIEQWLNKQWYGPSVNPIWRVLAWPLSRLFAYLANKDSAKKKHRAKQWQRPNIPIIVVGNITVGGSGKTPVVIALVEHFKAQGLNPAVISRGYGADRTGHGADRNDFPHLVTASDTANEVGDEPLLIVDNTLVPLVIDPNRQRGVSFLLEQAQQTGTPVDVIVSDDGLQHYQLPRDIELVVVDGKRGFGNQHLLPLGPLREPLERLNTVDFVLLNGAKAGEFTLSNHRLSTDQLSEMTLLPSDLKPVNAGVSGRAFDAGSSNKVHAVSGIGNPDRFFDTLKALGFNIIEHRFADHHAYQASDFHFLTSQPYPIVMTEKDAVKCRNLNLDSLNLDNAWYLPVKAVLPNGFWHKLDSTLKGLL